VLDGCQWQGREEGGKREGGGRKREGGGKRRDQLIGRAVEDLVRPEGCLVIVSGAGKREGRGKEEGRKREGRVLRSLGEVSGLLVIPQEEK
jgi:hypothetical protein